MSLEGKIKPKKRGIRQKISELIYRPERTREAFDRMRQDAGFIPIFNIDDLEARRQEIRKILTMVKDNIFDPTKGPGVQRSVVQQTFQLFFCEGDPWYRGLDDRELAEKVSCFLANCTDCGYLEPFMPDLFEEAMQLLHLSFRALDVTNTPPYIIESRPVVTPLQKQQYDARRIDEYATGTRRERSDIMSQD